MKFEGATLDFAHIAVAVLLVATIILDHQQQEASLELSRMQLQSAEEVRDAQMRPWVGRVTLTLDLHNILLENGTILTGDQFKDVLSKYTAIGSQTFRTQNLLPAAAVEEVKALKIQELVFQMQFQNKGQLPAQNMSFRSNSTVDTIPTVDDVPSADSVPTFERRLLLPDDEVFSRATIPYDRYEAILDGNHVLYLMYVVDYDYPGGGKGWYTYIGRINPNLTHNQINAQAG